MSKILFNNASLCRPSDSIFMKMLGLNPGLDFSARSHSYSARYHSYSARSRSQTGCMSSSVGQISSLLGQISSSARLDLIPSSARSYPPLGLISSPLGQISSTARIDLIPTVYVWYINLHAKWQGIHFEPQSQNLQTCLGLVSFQLSLLRLVFIGYCIRNI